MPKLFVFLMSFSFLFSCEDGMDKKHLFILSGQSNMARLDPEISFIPTLQAAFRKENIIVVKDAMGSQPISRWYKNWTFPNSDTPENRGDLYDKLIGKVLDSIQNKNIASVTFIWMQGERDARMEYSDVYEESLMGLYNQLGNDLERTDINFIIGRLNDFDMKNEKWPHWTKIRDIQVKVGTSNSRFAWINTDDLNDRLNGNNIEVINDLHMSVEGYKILGERFAKKAIELIEKN